MLGPSEHIGTTGQGCFRCNRIQLPFTVPSLARRDIFAIGAMPLLATAPKTAAASAPSAGECIRDMATKNAQREPQMHREYLRIADGWGGWWWWWWWWMQTDADGKLPHLVSFSAFDHLMAWNASSTGCSRSKLEQTQCVSPLSFCEKFKQWNLYNLMKFRYPRNCQSSSSWSQCSHRGSRLCAQFSPLGLPWRRDQALWRPGADAWTRLMPEAKGTAITHKYLLQDVTSNYW